MDLAAIKEKIRTFQYLSRQDMMADMKLIQTNCWEYNRLRNPHLPPMADLLVTICEDAFKEVLIHNPPHPLPWLNKLIWFNFRWILS